LVRAFPCAPRLGASLFFKLANRPIPTIFLPALAAVVVVAEAAVVAEVVVAAVAVGVVATEDLWASAEEVAVAHQPTRLHAHRRAAPSSSSTR
jgi:hypothetical protein